MSCGSVLEVFIADEFEFTSASLIVIRAHFMDLFTQNARKGEIWLAKRKQDHKINIILICLRTTMRVFAHAPLLIATYITYEGAFDLSRHPPPAATKPFVRACLFLRALRVWPCLEHHLDSYSDSVSRCLSSSLGGKILAFCLTFIQFAFVPPADHFPVSLCLRFCRSSVNIPYLLYTILDMCFPSLIPFLFELFNYLLVFFFFHLFFFFFMFFFPNICGSFVWVCLLFFVSLLIRYSPNWLRVASTFYLVIRVYFLPLSILGTALSLCWFR